MTTTLKLPQGMAITGEIKPGYEAILTPEALELVAKLHRQFEPRRREL
ncbi:malate synthase A, partial [Burkholderia mallei GB8 horse 4]